MNYLGNLLLSGTDDCMIVGNFLTDILPLKDLKKLSGEYVKGIDLHQFIDSSTDISLYFKNTLTQLGCVCAAAQ